jgi:hypothetical protein
MRTRFDRLSFGFATALVLVSSGWACSGNSASPPDAGGEECSGAACPDAGPFYGCVATFSGDFAETDMNSAGCAIVSPIGIVLDGGVPYGTGGFADSNPDGGADWLLQVQVFSNSLEAPLVVLVDLGPTPSPGTYNADTGVDWSAVIIDTIPNPDGATAYCEFSAGAQSVPEGSFTADVTSIAGLDTGTGVVHGTVQVVLYTQASPGTTCGDGPPTGVGTSATEQVAISF